MKYIVSLLLYRILLVVISPLIIALLIIKSKKNSAFRHRLTERLGFVPQSFNTGGIVVHAASVGEVIALKPFIEKLLLCYPELPITVTTFTPTGSSQVKKLFADRVQHCYLPLDIFICTWFFLNKLKPQAIVFMETELWPNLIAQAAHKKIKLLLVNARLSQHSLDSYQKIAWLIKPSLNHFDEILPQSTINLSHFISLGADKSRCHVVGNLKFDIKDNADIEDKKTELSTFLPTKRKIWLVASTHQGDEELALQAYKKIVITQPNLLLILVPRHPERFKTVGKLCQQHQLSLVKRSNKEQVTQSTNIWLLDSLGELMAVYALADIVTMGGSFNEVNGHNPLEPALFQKPIIVGPYMANFIEIEQQLKQVNGIWPLTSTNVDELSQAVDALLNDELKQKRLGHNAQQVVLANQGASEKSIKVLQTLLEQTNTMTCQQNSSSYCQYNATLLTDFDAQMLSSDYWQQRDAISGSAQGRGTTWFIHYQDKHMVLRHYYRGGLIGKFNKDHYIFTSKNTTRAAKEFNLLGKMQQWQLPAPAPIAYRVIRKGLFYQADLLSSRVEHAKDLVAILTEQAITDEVWFEIGKMIKRFHDRGIYHHDLNSHNILLDDNNKSWLIDFDQGELREIANGWQQANMQRLLRSFRKEKNQLPQFFWSEGNWSMLQQGYEQS